MGKIKITEMMKTVFKITIVFILIYAIILTFFTGMFDLFNKNANLPFWTSVLESDLPNLIAIIAMIYVVYRILKSFGR